MLSLRSLDPSRGYRQVNRKIILRCDLYQMGNGVGAMGRESDIYLRMRSWDGRCWSGSFKEGVECSRLREQCVHEF